MDNGSVILGASMIDYKITKNQAGNVSVVFGLALLPIISLGGLAIDFQAAVTSKARVQSIIDAAVLRGARSFQINDDQDSTRAIINSVIQAQIAPENKFLSCHPADIGFDDSGTEITIDLDCSHATSIMPLVGINEVNFRVKTASVWGTGELDIAFMFDISGSMNYSGRLEALKTAAIDAVDILLPE